MSFNSSLLAQKMLKSIVIRSPARIDAVRGGRKRRGAEVKSFHQTASSLASSAAAEGLDHSALDALQSLLGSSDALTHFSSALYERLAGSGLPDIEESHLLSLADAAAYAAHFKEAPVEVLSQIHHSEPSLSGMALASLPSVAADLAASGAVDAALQSTSALFSGMGAFLGQRLSEARALDAPSADSLQLSVTSILDALRATLDAEAATTAQQGLVMLSLSLQQVFTSLQGSTSPAGLDAVVGLRAASGELVSAGGIGLDSLIKVAVGAIAVITASVPSEDFNRRADAEAALLDGMPVRYDPVQLAAYFGTRPIRVLRRQAEVSSKLSAVLVAILYDWRSNNWEANMPSRAAWLRSVLEELGPAYVKIGQALSTRIDVFPEPYLHELQKLQDKVPGFCTVQARALVEEELGQPIESIFAEFSDQPVASASLGQVYKGTLLPVYGGGTVAIKVQRPSVMESVALDVLLMRKCTSLISAIPQFSDGWCEVLDDWAGRFFQEMDYTLEAYNMITFKRQMASLEGIVVAEVYPELTTRRVIVTQWIVGEKLSNCHGADVLPLCNALLNCYLIQLLETGFLHADPHPGNLLRTPDGKICILDFGLMSEIDLDQRIHLIEYMTHLTLEDWDGVTQDLVALGFLPKGLTYESAEMIAPVMKEVMGQLLHSGTQGISIGSVSFQLEGVARKYKMVIPPFFALVLRAFSVIEGIALKHDPHFNIVARCFPYLSTRLLSDNHPRIHTALKQLLYGDGQRLDVARLQKLMTAFAAFSVSPTKGAAAGPAFSDALDAEERVKGSRWVDQPAVVDDMTKDALLVVFSKKGSYAQELVVEEMVAAVDALSREALGEALKLALTSASAVTTMRSIEALGPLRAMILPMPMPTDFLMSWNSRVSLTDEDKQALSTIELLLDMMSGEGGGARRAGARSRMADSRSAFAAMDDTLRSGRRVLQGAGELLPIMPELLPGVQVTCEMFFKQLIRRMALRLADDLRPETGKPGHSS